MTLEQIAKEMFERIKLNESLTLDDLLNVEKDKYIRIARYHQTEVLKAKIDIAELIKNQASEEALKIWIMHKILNYEKQLAEIEKE